MYGECKVLGLRNGMLVWLGCSEGVAVGLQNMGESDGVGVRVARDLTS